MSRASRDELLGEISVLRSVLSDVSAALPGGSGLQRLASRYAKGEGYCQCDLNAECAAPAEADE